MTLLTACTLAAMASIAFGGTYDIRDQLGWGGKIGEFEMEHVSSDFPMLGEGGNGFTVDIKSWTAVTMNAGQDMIDLEAFAAVYDPNNYGTNNSMDNATGSSAGDTASWMKTIHIVPGWSGAYTTSTIGNPEPGVYIRQDTGYYSTVLSNNIETTPSTMVEGKGWSGLIDGAEEYTATSIPYVVFD